MHKMKLLSGLITVALVGASLHTLSLASAGGAAAPTTTVLAADAQTTRVVNAANAFLATLTAAQKKAVLFAWTDNTQRKNWSNFPQGGAGVNRQGVPWGDLNATQKTALMTLLGTVLSEQGVAMVQGQMDADDITQATDSGTPGGRTNAGTASPTGAAGSATAGAQGTPPPAGQVGNPAGGPPPGAGGARAPVKFGSESYFVSFVGTPSTTSPWMMQFGGHHLAINATVVGPNIGLSPTLTGGEPVRVSFNNQTFTIIPQVPVEMTAASALLNSLTAAQQAKVVISTNRIDLVLGPGHDGQTLQPEGLPGSQMTAAQKTLFLALIRDRLGILNANDLAAKMTDIQKNLSQTYFAWYGPTAAGSAAYWRVTGPTAIIEFSPQATDGDPTNHLHNMYRDPTNEYGAAWTSLK
ncbi:DUF3500 domain-containing protein [Deinococcus aestuarii]|uniref:DUF3500 domain-containing protein n=1 Tax=Deinococcus aestuarii TaxID=2774531 RepID=UPI001C0C31F3|nr:DUF3500 domain-containing protein [Deinococcus aestuarii]